VLKERPLTDKEISILQRDIKQLEKRNTYQRRFLLGWTIVAFLIFTIVFYRLDSKTEYYLLYGTVIIYMLIGVWVYLENIKKTKKQKNNLDFVMAENKAK
jgi:L-asparagine transporter-like permease